MNHKFSIIFNSLLLLILGLTACDDNTFDVDITDQKVELEWLRFEHDITGLATKPSFTSYNDSLIQVYGSFYKFYSGRVMNFGAVDAPGFERNIMGFLMDKNVHQLFQNVDSAFYDLSPYHSEINTAFSYYHYYFPNKQPLVITSMVGGLNRNIVVTDSILAVGLDMYLGDSNEIYTLAQLPGFISKKCTPDYMVYDMMRGWVLSEFEPKDKKDDVLSQIVNYGKSIYAMDALFPFSPDHYKIGFMEDEIKWCHENEVTIWAKMIEEQQLYSTDLHVIRSLTGPGPFSAGFPRESPAQIGYWIGWQIVRSYMTNNPDVTLKELMNKEDAQHILRQSKYKPR
ncbi:MAG: hypothetical protein ACI9GM_000320 [Salibacteraceae bacterium]|jgi:hypothetical protein